MTSIIKMLGILFMWPVQGSVVSPKLYSIQGIIRDYKIVPFPESKWSNIYPRQRVILIPCFKGVTEEKTIP